MKAFKMLNALCLALLMSLCQGGVAQTSSEDVPNYRDQVQIMYVAYYGRPGDTGGLDFWAGKLEEVDGDLWEIIDSFGNSMEFTERFGDLDNEELVNNIFRQLLGRDADSGGLNFYLNGLRVGRYTLASIALDVANGTKMKPHGRDNTVMANKLRVANVFSETYVEAGADYGEYQIDDARLWLAGVDSTDASVTAALDRLPDLLEMFAGGTQRPDLEVGSPSVSDNSLAKGASFKLSVTVRNTGDGDSAPTTLRYYRSADAAISVLDTQVGTDAVETIAASGTSPKSVSVTPPAGSYYYGSCVDTVTNESDTTNNCSSPVTVTVGETSGPPDPVVRPPPTSDSNPGGVAELERPNLRVGSPSVDDTCLETGASFRLSATVSNTGGGGSAAATLRYYLSSDSKITSSDTAVGVNTVTAVAASGSSAESKSLTAPSVVGTYYYGACVDAVTDETGTADNCSASVQVTVSDGGPPAMEVHLFRPQNVEENDGDVHLYVFAWTTGYCAPTESISVRVWLVSGTAEEGSDFSRFSQLVEFNVADFKFRHGLSRYEAQERITITILDDTEAEADETIGATMMLEGARPFVTLFPDYPDQGPITILDNDAASQNTVEVTAPKKWAPTGDSVTVNVRSRRD